MTLQPTSIERTTIALALVFVAMAQVMLSAVAPRSCASFSPSGLPPLSISSRADSTTHRDSIPLPGEAAPVTPTDDIDLEEGNSHVIDRSVTLLLLSPIESLRATDALTYPSDLAWFRDHAELTYG
ncbi:hypothetical protein [Schlesneria sp. DSM 10557]|uniref:hypothetical protein n=1 Tax=Schlesneria sp. DSM 10557 TaxID=3044399 RepID=UPI00359FF252